MHKYRLNILNIMTNAGSNFCINWHWG